MNDKTSEIATFIEFMKLIKKSNKGFKYTMLQDSNSNHTGNIWQISIMCNNFNYFGYWISIDTLKRDINVFLWNYIAMPMINEICDIMTVNQLYSCEGIWMCLYNTISAIPLKAGLQI